MTAQLLLTEHAFINGGFRDNVGVVVQDGRITYVGEMDGAAAQAQSLVSSKPGVVETQNVPVLLPAMTDAHNHPILYGGFRAIEPAMAFGISDGETLERKMRQQLPAAGLALAIGWDTSSLSGLTRTDLDKIRAEPWALMDMSYHGAVGNTAFCRDLLGQYMRDERLLGSIKGNCDEDGRMTEEYAMLPYEMIERAMDEAKLVASAEAYVVQMYAGGAAYTHDMVVTTPLQLKVLAALSRGARAAITMTHITPRMVRSLVWGDKNVDLSDHGLKLFADGSNSSRTALYYHPYLRTDQHGIEYHSIAEAEEAMNVAFRYGIRRVAIHAIGDRGIDNALMMCQKWIDIADGEYVTCRIEHATMATGLQIQQARDRGIWLCPQPNFNVDVISFADRFQADRLTNMVPLAEMVHRNKNVMIGTDGMPNNMLLAIHCAVVAPFKPQAISLTQALYFASASAPQFERACRGEIVVGQPADLLIGKSTLIDMLRGNHGLYEANSMNYEGVMASIGLGLKDEVMGLMRAGEWLIKPKIA